MKDTVTTDIPEHGRPTDSDAGQSAHDHADPQSTTEHLRQLWLAGGRDITVTYDNVLVDGVVRQRAHLAFPRHSPDHSRPDASSPDDSEVAR